MTAPEGKQKSGEVCSQTRYLKKALGCKGLQEMLHGDAGAFTFRYWFINEYINIFGVIGPQLVVESGEKYPRKSKRLINMFNIIKQFMKFARIIAINKQHNPADILFISRNRKARIKTQSGYQEGDYIFYSVVSELKRRHPELSHAMYLSMIPTLNMSMRRLLIYFNPSTVPWKNSYPGNFVGNPYQIVLKRWDITMLASSLERYFSFRPLLKNVLLGYVIKSMLSTYDPRVIVSNDDCLYTRPLVDRDIKMIVLQSASIVKNIEDCRALIFRDSRMQPELFLCAGCESAEIKSAASAARTVIVTGQPRYDILFNMQALYSKKDFKEHYGIKPEQKIVLWTTQTHGLSREENCENLHAVFEAFQGMDGVKLIIKQHPAETEAHTGLINDLLDSYDVDAIRTPKDSDTYEQLFACDLMVTKHSTTAIEAVALDKPVVILNLSKKPDIVDYVRKNVAAGVYEKKDLRETILRLLNDDGELKKNRDAYIGRNLFKIDGKATDRVVDAIDQMIASQER